MELPKSDQKYIVRLVNLQTGRFAERVVREITLDTIRNIESKGVIQILDVREGI